MSYEAWGTPPDHEPRYCPLCDQESHSPDCELGKMQARAFLAEQKLAELLYASKRAIDECCDLTATPAGDLLLAATSGMNVCSVEDTGIAGFKPWVATHLKTGNEYRVIGEAIDATNSASGRVVVIYRGNGQTFVRCADEFMDKFRAEGGAS